MELVVRNVRVSTDVCCSSSRGAGTETNSLTGWLRPTLNSSSAFISTSALLHQSSGVNRIFLVNSSNNELWVNVLTSPFQNGKPNVTCQKVVQPFDSYQNSLGRHYQNGQGVASVGHFSEAIYDWAQSKARARMSPNSDGHYLTLGPAHETTYASYTDIQLTTRRRHNISDKFNVPICHF